MTSSGTSGNAAPNLVSLFHSFDRDVWLWAAKVKIDIIISIIQYESENNGKQMRNLWDIGEMESEKQTDNVWEISTPKSAEKVFGKHPTQKPLELLRRIIIASTKEGDLVLDPFCGSSTTGVEAVLLNRKYVGMDLDAEIFGVI
jgi:site-specific DNA-methyltransferase (adenine-specific)